MLLLIHQAIVKDTVKINGSHLVLLFFLCSASNDQVWDLNMRVFHSCVGIVLLFVVCPKLNHEPSSPQPVGLHVPSATHSFCHGTRWYSVQIYVQSE